MLPTNCRRSRSRFCVKAVRKRKPEIRADTGKIPCQAVRFDFRSRRPSNPREATGACRSVKERPASWALGGHLCGRKVWLEGMLRQALPQAIDRLVTGWRKADPIPPKKKAPDLWHAARCATPRPTVGDVLEPFRLFCRISIFLG